MTGSETFRQSFASQASNEKEVMRFKTPITEQKVSQNFTPTKLKISNDQLRPSSSRNIQST